MRDFAKCLSAALLAACLASTACADDDGSPSTDGSAFSADAVYHQGVGTEEGPDYDAGEVALLTESHDGWQKPNCWQCHPGAVEKPGKCAPCHGPNGAPLQPLNHRNDPALFGTCSACHWPLRYVHQDMAAYYDFEDCSACHHVE